MARKLLLISLCLISGCASLKTVDSTLAVQAITASEGGSDTMVIPGYVTGNPELRDKLFVIAPGKGTNSSGAFYYADGTKAAEWKKSRSEVTEALLASIAGIDAEKFLEAARERQFAADIIHEVLTIVQPLITKALAESPSPVPSVPTLTPEQKAIINAELTKLGLPLIP